MKNLERMYIISWFGNSEIREKRKNYHTRQIDWAVENGLEVYVFAQGYGESDYDPRVVYLPNDSAQILLPADARNHCLRHFYNSDANFAVVADNDSNLHSGPQHCDSKDFVSLFNRLPLSDLTEVDFFFPLNPGKKGFNSTYNEHPEKFKQNFVFTRNTDSKGSFAVLKNLKKFYNTEIFYDEVSYKSSDGKIITHEDVDFGVQMLVAGFSCYELTNTVLLEFASNNNSTWSVERSEETSFGKQILRKKFGLTSNSAGHTQYSAVYKNNPRPNKLLIPKSGSQFRSLFEFGE